MHRMKCQLDSNLLKKRTRCQKRKPFSLKIQFFLQFFSLRISCKNVLALQSDKRKYQRQTQFLSSTFFHCLLFFNWISKKHFFSTSTIENLRDLYYLLKPRVISYGDKWFTSGSIKIHTDNIFHLTFGATSYQINPKTVDDGSFYNVFPFYTEIKVPFLMISI